ncbi:Glycerophosphodiester phosphodiesterase domain-containing protein 5 [Bagarius yarrelli]|uniref:Glycerophosphodiester phosphodiesterase domain-containing protein 5 n=1 Tax=Bagarius yarrelli TaxID=175774 RepID=A0A556U3H7_BAGYA|nr:Glycerophosphodiester phosphodiesterase domain-containing protein 5 [Bagarius yarrelli]
MVKHQPLQVYERQLCLSCLTGIYGCRWKRYQRSHDDSSKILGLCHIALGQQLNLYWIHKIGVLAVLLTTITGVVSIDDIWRDEWDVILISLQSNGPFLHIGAVAAMTALGWIVAGLVVRGERTSEW